MTRNPPNIIIPHQSEPTKPRQRIIPSRDCPFVILYKSENQCTFTHSKIRVLRTPSAGVKWPRLNSGKNELNNHMRLYVNTLCPLDDFSDIITCGASFSSLGPLPFISQIKLGGNLSVDWCFVSGF